MTAPTGTGCVDCLQSGEWWLHLRRCVECGNIGCCDSSPMQHATAHFHATAHPVITSFEPGEEWFWDYTTDAFTDPSPLDPPLEYPAGQPTPGPAGRVPGNWQQLLH